MTEREKSDIIKYIIIDFVLIMCLGGRMETELRFSDIVKALAAAGIDNAKHEAAYLASHFCGIDRDRLILSLDDIELDSNELDEAIKKRSNGYPLQYILGEWEFYGLPFRIREGCLIPRSDTEILVERAVSSLPRGICFADVCCGSGCIAVSVLKHRPDLRALAIDLYDVPLSLTRENAELNGVSDRISIERCDVLTEGDRLISLLSGCGYIISNPPYIPDGDVPALQREVHCEPSTALCGGDDGMDFYRVLTGCAKLLGIPALFEIGYDQGEQTVGLAHAHGMTCKVYKDYSGNDRVAEVRG